MMQYISTRGSAPTLTFDEAMLTGLAVTAVCMFLPRSPP